MEQKESDFLVWGLMVLAGDNSNASTDPSSETVSRSQAFLLYGRPVVESWIREGLIHPVKVGSGSKKIIDRMKLAAVARAYKC